LCLCVAHSAAHRNKEKERWSLQASVTSHSQQHEPELSRHYGKIELEPELMLHLQEDREHLHISLLIEDCERASRSLDIIQSMLRKLNCEVMGEGLNWETYVEDLSTGRFIRYERAKEDTLHPWFSSPTKNTSVQLNEFAMENQPTQSRKAVADLDTFLDHI